MHYEAINLYLIPQVNFLFILSRMGHLCCYREDTEIKIEVEKEGKWKS